MKGGVEHGHLRHAWAKCAGQFDTAQIGRMVQRRQWRELAQLLQIGGIEQQRRTEAIAAMHHAMANGAELRRFGNDAVLRQKTENLS